MTRMDDVGEDFAFLVVLTVDAVVLKCARSLSLSCMHAHTKTSPRTKNSTHQNKDLHSLIVLMKDLSLVILVPWKCLKY